MQSKAHLREPEGTSPIGEVSSRPVVDDARSRLAAIVEGSSDAILGTDLEGIVTSWSSAAEATFGYPSEEMIASSGLLNPRERSGEAEGIRTRVRQGERVPAFDTLREAWDKRLFEVTVTVSPIRNGPGQVVGTSAIIRDNSVAKQHARELSRMSRLCAAWSQIDQAIVGMSGRADRFERVCRLLVQAGGLRMAWIGCTDEVSQRVGPVASFRDDLGYLRQIETGLARGHEGTGLGLAIWRRLAELVGGAIGVESAWGRGSPYSLTLPLGGPKDS